MEFHNSKIYNDIVNLVLNETERLILLLLISEGCEKHTTGWESKLFGKLEEMSKNEELKTELPALNLVKICIPQNQMPFPRPVTPAIYYFQPKNLNSLFMRDGNTGIDNIERDLRIAKSMCNGLSYEEALYTSEEDRKRIKETEQLLNEDAEKSKYPSVSKMLKGFASEMWETAKFAGKGLPVLVPQDVSAERYSLCQSCEFLTEQARCTKCGCFMKTKVNLSSASCPIGKWGKVE